MYLVSIYFDNNTEKELASIINSVAKATGNTFMLDNNVPPHITVSGIETKKEELVIEALERVVSKLDAGDIHFVSVGAFLPQVIYVEALMNGYLQELSKELFDKLSKVEETMFNPYYKPFEWLPHCTIGKTLSDEQMIEAFKVLQKRFVTFKGTINRIGIAKTNPHRDIKVWEIKDN